MSRKLIEKTKNILRNEIGTVFKNKGLTPVSVALAYPNTYYVGQSNLGFQTIYNLLNKRLDVRCERAFIPDKEDEEELKRTNYNLFSLESQQFLKEFNVLAFSISFELDYLNLVKLLDLAGIPVFTADRDEKHPLLIAGGPCMTFNPEPLADLLDLIVIGEGEEVINELFDLISSYLTGGMADNRDELLLQAAKIPGIYVPKFYRERYDGKGKYLGTKPMVGDVPEKITRRWIRKLDDFPTKSVILTPNTEFGNMFLIEVSRGCGRHCRFCMAGYCYRFPRVRSLASILRQVEEGKQHRDRIGLMGAAISDYPWIDELCAELNSRNLSVSVASFRVDSVTPALIKTLVAGGLRTLTVAPEAGSERLRKVINKGITEEDILKASGIALAAGMEQIRYYLMVGLPTETEEDLKEIVSLVEKVNEYAKPFRTGGFRKISLSVNPFIPKPFTPFQWEPMDSRTNLERKIKWLKQHLNKYKNLDIGAESPRLTIIQGLLARGDRKLGKVIVSAFRAGGNLTSWKKALTEEGLDFDSYLYRKRAKEDFLPWDHLDWGVDKEYLWEERLKAEKEEFTSACLPKHCRRCGVCRGEDRN